MKIGQKIKELREKANLTQEELAKHLNTTRQSIIKIEKDTQEVSLNMLAKISQVFGTTVDYLISEQINKPLDFMQSGGIVLREYNYIDTEKLDRLLQSTGQYEVKKVTTTQQKISERGGSLGGGVDLSIMGKGAKTSGDLSTSKNVANSVVSELSKTTINKATELLGWISKNPSVLISDIDGIEDIGKGAMAQIDIDLDQNKFEKALVGIEELMSVLSAWSPNAISSQDQKMMKMIFTMLTNQRYSHLISETKQGVKMVGLYRKDMIVDGIESVLGENTVLLKIQKVLNDTSSEFSLLPKILSKSLTKDQLYKFIDSLSGLNQFGLEFSEEDLHMKAPVIIYEPILSFK